MAKELPYFKFYTSEWLDGDITVEELETQGLFINICALYWSKGGNIYLDKIQKRFRFASESCLNSLLEEDLIRVDDDGKIEISFLDEQMIERVNLSKTNSSNGKKGGRPRKDKSDKKPIGLISESELKANESNKEERRGEEKRREEKRKELLIKSEREEIIKDKFDFFWKIYDKKEDRKKCFIKFSKLKDEEISKILEVVHAYAKSKPDRQFRKNPLTWLNGSCWNDEIIIYNTLKNGNSNRNNGKRESLFGTHFGKNGEQGVEVGTNPQGENETPIVGDNSETNNL